MSANTEKKPVDWLVVALTEYPDDALVGVLGVAANVRGFRVCMEAYANRLIPLLALSDDTTRERIATIRGIASRLAILPQAIPHPINVEAAETDQSTGHDLLETSAFLMAQDSEDLAVLLVEGARSADLLRALDDFQRRLYPLAGLGTATEREKIYHLRLICGLLMSTVELPGFCRRWGDGFESPDGLL